MSMSSYEHIGTGKLFIFEDSLATRLFGFRKVAVPEEETAPVASSSKPKAAKPTSSKEGNK